MPVSQKVKDAVLTELQKSEPLMDVEAIKKEFLEWLASLPLPSSSSVKQWEECLRLYPSTPEERHLTSGVRVRLSLPLYTHTNKYLIVIMESLTPASRGIYFLSAHVNWQEKEWRRHKALEELYHGKSEDSLKAIHTIWAQTFRQGELAEALNDCAKAMLGHELVGKPCEEEATASPVTNIMPQPLTLPENDDKKHSS